MLGSISQVIASAEGDKDVIPAGLGHRAHRAQCAVCQLSSLHKGHEDMKEDQRKKGVELLGHGS